MKKSPNEANSRSVCIIGLGQIGSRHLQALLKCDLNINIFCVDLSDHSIAKAKSLIPKKLPENIMSVNYYKDSKYLPSEIDLAILSTSADIRLKALKSLLNYSKTKNVIFEKILFQSSSHLYEASSILKNAEINSWVNCPRRSWQIYKELKEYLDGKKNISLELSGGNWGLACNSIHFLDLFEWLTNSNLKTISSRDLDLCIYDSKRTGFVELGGKLEANYNNGNKLILNSNRKLDNETFSINLYGEDFDIEILESEGSFLLKELENVISKEFKAPYISEITNLFVNDIFSSEECCLPTFSESLRQHEIMLDSFKTHIEKTTQEKIEYCPIT